MSIAPPIAAGIRPEYRVIPSVSGSFEPSAPVSSEVALQAPAPSAQAASRLEIASFGVIGVGGARAGVAAVC